MRYLNRKFDKWLELWQANPDRKPLLVKGARQVGKTESIRHFAKKHSEYRQNQVSSVYNNTVPWFYLYILLIQPNCFP